MHKIVKVQIDSTTYNQFLTKAGKLRAIATGVATCDCGLKFRMAYSAAEKHRRLGTELDHVEGHKLNHNEL
ncbi:hypothetical protein Bpfe_031135 [Biomphalaria pfeifferi]|uniref:Uncharacterized protein n=1 Tax=Biomphalaria pfeifferi TaxID=112525 RepID=A0AAD8APJ5_BIOPF|nr:hypothetical protein Bpfe_031135 [Biomphalaria pfeifferi]